MRLDFIPLRVYLRMCGLPSVWARYCGVFQPRVDRREERGFWKRLCRREWRRQVLSAS